MAKGNWRKRIKGTAKQVGKKFKKTTSGRMKGAKKSKILHAKDFGDDPDIRHSHGENTQINVQEPWERRYAVEKHHVKKLK